PEWVAGPGRWPAGARARGFGSAREAEPALPRAGVASPAAAGLPDFSPSPAAATETADAVLLPAETSDSLSHLTAPTVAADPGRPSGRSSMRRWFLIGMGAALHLAALALLFLILSGRAAQWFHSPAPGPEPIAPGTKPPSRPPNPNPAPSKTSPTTPDPTPPNPPPTPPPRAVPAVSPPAGMPPLNTAPGPVAGPALVGGPLPAKVAPLVHDF